MLAGMHQMLLTRYCQRPTWHDVQLYHYIYWRMHHDQPDCQHHHSNEFILFLYASQHQHHYFYLFLDLIGSVPTHQLDKVCLPKENAGVPG